MNKALFTKEQLEYLEIMNYFEETPKLTGDMFKGIDIQKDFKPRKEKPYYRKFEKRKF